MIHIETERKAAITHLMTSRPSCTYVLIQLCTVSVITHLYVVVCNVYSPWACRLPGRVAVEGHGHKAQKQIRNPIGGSARATRTSTNQDTDLSVSGRETTCTGCTVTSSY